MRRMHAGVALLRAYGMPIARIRRIIASNRYGECPRIRRVIAGIRYVVARIRRVAYSPLTY